ncbi:MAG: glycosyltransferase family 2 protein [Fuerstiella sp.]
MMMIASVTALLLVAVLWYQVKWAAEFRALYKKRPSVVADVNLPHVGVVLSLRGADPFLEKCLLGLMSQDYPSHEIHIIVDSTSDPAAAVVERVRERLNATNVHVEFLKLCQDTSSLKNCALIQGIHSCSDSCEVFAWLDSDTVPFPGWLRDLVSPLQSENVGAACGVRWYAPPSTTLANYVRHIWNSAAVLQMVTFNIGWGGAFAIRKSVYQKASLATKWCRALVEDTLASNEILLDGGTIAFVPECTMPNPESVSLSWCLSFVTRQLQGLRYYHRAWRTVMLFGLLSGALLMLNVGLIVVGIAAANFDVALLAGASLATFGLIAGRLMQRSEQCVNTFIGDRAVGGFSLPWMLALAAPMAQVIHFVALVRAYTLNDVTWRGIRYHIRSGLDLKRTNYAPYASTTEASEHSL